MKSTFAIVHHLVLTHLEVLPCDLDVGVTQGFPEDQGIVPGVFVEASRESLSERMGAKTAIVFYSSLGESSMMI